MSDRNDKSSNASSYDSMFNGSLNNGERGDNGNNFNWIIFIIIFFLIIRKESCFNFLNGCFKQQNCHNRHQNNGCNNFGFNGNGNILWIFGILIVLWLIRGNGDGQICDDRNQNDGKCDEDNQVEDFCDEEISDDNCDEKVSDEGNCEVEISDDDECKEEISDQEDCEEEDPDEEDCDCDEDETADEDYDEEDPDEVEPGEVDSKSKTNDLQTEAEFC